MYSVVRTSIVQGIKSIPVHVEADVSDGMPVFEMVGFLSAEVKEAKERVRTALRNSGYRLPAKRITINFMPANVRKTGSGFDLPIALSILGAMRVIPEEKLKEVFVIGEVGLNGEVRPVHGILPMLSETVNEGIRICIVPYENAAEAELVKHLRVYAVQSIREVIDLLNGKPYRQKFSGQKLFQEENVPDFSEINGQQVLKRACEIAVCGMHNLLMLGPPGAGKTMAAMRIPTILPPLDEKEQMELSKIYSVSGLFSNREQLMDKRPFRSPHHTISPQGLAGGGSIPRPGEISLAHKGVLFLDELPEFKKDTLEVLRQPLEEKVVRLVRMHGDYEYPADFMLVAAMNPCKCGYFPDMQKCSCSRGTLQRYINRISQPLLDRIDICVVTPQIPFEELREKREEESSEKIRERVTAAHERMKYRYRNEEFSYNSQVPAAKLNEYCALLPKQEAYMEKVYEKLNLTARSYHKILRVARTLADMEDTGEILQKHLNEAVCCRNIDRKLWA